MDQTVADLFGFHALQLGLPALDALAANRMPHRWVASADAAGECSPQAGYDLDAADPMPLPATASLRCDFDALPFDAHSLDLVVLPHTLELSRDPHQTLREVERVLRPEGRVVIVGFNPASLWGLRQRFGHVRQRVGSAERANFLPRSGEFLAYRRLRDWLRLLSFEVESGRFGCYRPPVASPAWLARFGWVEPVGDRWWPVFGAVYALTAVKRVRGMRLVGLAREQRVHPKAAPVAIVQQQGLTVPEHQREAA